MPPPPPKPKFQKTVLARIANKVADIKDVTGFLAERSPVPVDGQDSASVLRHLYRSRVGRKNSDFHRHEIPGAISYGKRTGATSFSNGICRRAMMACGFCRNRCPANFCRIRASTGNCPGGRKKRLRHGVMRCWKVMRRMPMTGCGVWCKCHFASPQFASPAVGQFMRWCGWTRRARRIGTGSWGRSSRC